MNATCESTPVDGDGHSYIRQLRSRRRVTCDGVIDVLRSCVAKIGSDPSSETEGQLMFWEPPELNRNYVPKPKPFSLPLLRAQLLLNSDNPIWCAMVPDVTDDAVELREVVFETDDWDDSEPTRKWGTGCK